MPVKILVADDSSTMRKIMELTFAGEDAEVVTVETGEAAIAQAKQDPPSVIFADLSLPGGDGYALTEAIKRDPALASVAVIVMASQHVAYSEQKGQSAGVDDHVVKPFDTQVVIDKVKDVLSKPRAGVAAAAPVSARPAAPPAAAPPMPAPPPLPPRQVKSTVAFGQEPPAPAPVAAPPSLDLADSAPQLEVAPPSNAPAVRPKAPVPAPRVVSAAAAAGAGMADKLADAGLSPDQLEAVIKISREVIEAVVWEVVPDLAETLIREEIRRLTAD